MANIEVLFQLDTQIETALSLGTYERVGGVIRHSHSKQVVMWLHETSEVVPDKKITQGLLTSVLNKTGMNTSAMGMILGGSLPTLNLAMSGYTLYLMIERVRELEKQIETIHEKISEEFARDRQIEFEAALSNARDVIDTEDETYKYQAANRAIDQLYKAQQHRLTNFNELIANNPTFEQLQQAQTYLLQAMMISTMRVRCYLETNQMKMARSRLSEGIEMYYTHTRELIQQWLGKNHAMYFNSVISDEDFERYLEIEAWVRDVADVLPILVKEYRADFWNKEAIKPLNSSSFSFPFSNRSETASEPSYITALTQAEALIENFERFVGFELELASMRLSFDEWESYTKDIETDERYILLVDRDELEASSRLSG